MLLLRASFPTPARAASAVVQSTTRTAAFLLPITTRSYAKVRPRTRWSSSAAAATTTTPQDDDAARLLDEIEASLKGPCGLPNSQGTTPSHSIVVAVSGGADSMALLHLLARVRTRWNPPLNLTVAHFNHGLRPEAAKEEEAFVRQAAATLNVPIHVVTWGEKDRAQATGIQERARDWRRAECEQLVREQQQKQQGGAAPAPAGAAQGVIATAHHADDSLETWVLKLLRGTHLSHIKGMEPRAGAYVKPLLHVPKERLIHFLETQGLVWKEDDSNRIEKYKRNKVRLRLLPLMVEVAGGEAALKARMEEMTCQSKGLEEWLDREACAWEGRHAVEAPSDIVEAGDELWIGSEEMGSLWAPLPRLLKEESLHRFVARVTQGSISLPYGQVRRAMEQLERDKKEAEGGRKKKLQWRLEVGEGWVLGRQGDVLRVTKEEFEGRKDEEGESHAVSMPEAGVSFSMPRGWTVEAARLGPSSLSSSEKSWDLILPHVPLGARLQLRHRVDGDRFHPTWRPGPIKLKDFLRGQNVPLHRRNEVLLVVFLQANGEEEERVLGLHPTGHVAAVAPAGANENVQPLGLRFGKKGQ